MYIFFFFFRRSPAQNTKPIVTLNGSKDVVWAKEVPCKQVFFSIFTSWGSFSSKTSKMLPLVLKSQPNRKSRITFERLYIDKKGRIWNWVRSFRINTQNIRAAPSGEDFAMTSLPVNNKTSINTKRCMIKAKYQHKSIGHQIVHLSVEACINHLKRPWWNFCLDVVSGELWTSFFTKGCMTSSSSSTINTKRYVTDVKSQCNTYRKSYFPFRTLLVTITCTVLQRLWWRIC